MTTSLSLPAAPPVLRSAAAPVRRSKVPAVVLLLLGAALALGPVVGGVFSKVASGQQLIDAVAPHLTLDALDRYDGDLATLRNGAAAVDAVYAKQDVARGTYPGLDEYRAKAGAIDRRASDLLATIRASEPDYREVASIGGFDRVPFLVVAAGLSLAYAGGVLLGGRRRTGGALVLAGVASVALIGYPFVSDLVSGSRAGERLQAALAPVMTHGVVEQQQRDFVVLVHAVGELDTTFGDVPRAGRAARDVAALVKSWPAVSSDLADLVGALNDNIDNDRALADLDDLGKPLGTSGLVALPWFLVGAGAVGVLAALASWPRRRKDTS
ncbi:hypothetical protein ABIE44_001458 [Marmoricola sp. OAE513]|uniref:hypothetical protein n=1 Tax=Marmoricola sp. OAE513 TaxID=2817894 RepID=UPI001AEABA74